MNPTINRVNSGAPERNNVCKTLTPQSTVSTQVLRKGTMYVKHESHNQPCQLRCSGKEQCMQNMNPTINRVNSGAPERNNVCKT